MRLTAATVSLFVFSIIRRELKEVLAPILTNKENGIKFAIAGTFFGPIMGVSLSLFTVSLIDPSVAQTIFSLVPAFAYLLSAAFLKDKITFKSIVGLAIAIIGVVILIWRDRIKEII
jgi:drug/metabolite transporter (DMT)-like permease